jgi:DNA mismatch endonuclease (patch repair protein)
MPDVHNVLTRSKNMRAIKSKDTKPEILIRKALHARGLRFRLHVKTLPGTPDIVLARFKTVLFVNGCFWHGHRCRLSKTPQTRTAFWLSKISDTISRDRIACQKLRDAGWRIAVIWECEIKGRNQQKLDAVVDRFIEWLNDLPSQGLELP